MPLDPLLVATAVEAALKAGGIQKSRFGSDMRVDKKGAIDLVTEVDVAVERMVRQLVSERFPGHHILAEELGQAGDGEARGGYCWILDPLDGTTNYAHGMPVFCTSLALELDGAVVLGVVYDPMRGELFTAERGEGAFLNGARLKVSTVDRLIDALLVTGFPYDVHQTTEEIVGLFGAFISTAQAIRRLGSAALDLCYVAAGRMDGFWEEQLKPWDVAAAALVVEEAGGRVTGMDGSPFDCRSGQLLASNGPLHGEMLDVIAGFWASRSPHRTR